MRKIIPLILIAITLVGFFSPLLEVQAQEEPVEPIGLCQYGDPNNESIGIRSSKLTEKKCHEAHPNDFFGWVADTADQTRVSTDQKRSNLGGDLP